MADKSILFWVVCPAPPSKLAGGYLRYGGIVFVDRHRGSTGFTYLESFCANEWFSSASLLKLLLPSDLLAMD